MRRRLRLRSVLRFLGLLLVLLVCGGAVAWYVNQDVRYLVRAVVEEAGILWRRRPLTEVIADPETDAVTRGKPEPGLSARAIARPRRRRCAHPPARGRTPSLRDGPRNSPATR